MRTQLLEYSCNDTDLFYSKEIKEYFSLDEEIDLETHVKIILENFINKNPEHKKLIELYTKKQNLKGTAILSAHGESVDGRWKYNDGEHDFLVQGWINAKDEQYGLLIIHSCNPEGDEIQSKKSAVLVPNVVYNEFKHLQGLVNIELYIPGMKYIDSYTTEHSLKQLK
jgi:hypothetical protein